MRLWFETGGYVRVGTDGGGHLWPIQARGVDRGQKEVKRLSLHRIEPVSRGCLELSCHVRERFWRIGDMGKGQPLRRWRNQKVGWRYLVLRYE